MGGKRAGGPPRSSPSADAVADAAGPDAATIRALSWDALRGRLSDAQRAFRLGDMTLSARMRSYVTHERIETLGQLAELSSAQMTRTANLGRVTVGDLPRAIAHHVESLTNARTGDDDDLLRGFERALEPLDAIHRTVAARRSGLGGDPVPLRELGASLGVSHERVRNVEHQVRERCARQSWALDARRHVDRALREGAVPLAALADDRYWARAVAQPSVIRFMVEQVLQMGVRVVELGGASWLARHQAAVVEDALSGLLAAARTLKFPVAIAALAKLVARHASGLGPHVAGYLLEELKRRMRLDAEGRSALALGDTRHAQLLALLRASPTPMPVREAMRRLGRPFSDLPEEVVHLRAGEIGLRRHFPDFDDWQVTLVPAAVRIVRELGPERQWSCEELLSELREEHDVPDWLTPFGLAALIKPTTVLRSLGRLRVALPGSQHADNRLFVHELLDELLNDAGEPVPRTVLLEKLQARVGSFGFESWVFTRPQFVRIDADRVGLMSRDVPGGAGAIAEACDRINAVLARRARGLSAFHALKEISRISADHAAWSEQMTMSVLHADGRFRTVQGGAVGLAKWGATRVPTRLALLRSALEAGDGRVEIDDAMATIEAHYGRRPSRGRLTSIAMAAGARTEGAWVVRKAATGESARNAVRRR